MDLEPLKEIEQSARGMLGAQWQQATASDICERIEDLIDELDDPGHGPLSEAVLGFAAYLSAFTGSLSGPTGDKRQQLEALLDAMSEQLQRLETSSALDLMPPPLVEAQKKVEAPAEAEPRTSATPEPALAPEPAPTPPNTILFIDPTGRDAGALGMSLEELGYVVQPLLRLDRQIGQWLSRTEVKALILPAAGLDIWEKLVQIDPTLEQARRRIGLFVVARIDDARQRIKAGHAGADGFFVMPGDVDMLAREIVDVLHDRVDKYRALIVDDDASMTIVIESVLRRSGLETRVINDPAAALPVLEDFLPDVILLDLHMPGLNGLELLSLFRAHPKTAFIPVVLISGDEEEERRFETLTAGGDDYLLKPIRPKHLVAAVTGRAQRARWLRRALRNSAARLG